MSSDTATEAPLRRRRLGLLRFLAPAIVLFWILMAFVGPLVAPYDIGEILDAGIFEGMSGANWLGTDYFGRDMFSRTAISPGSMNA